MTGNSLRPTVILRSSADGVGTEVSTLFLVDAGIDRTELHGTYCYEIVAARVSGIFEQKGCNQATPPTSCVAPVNFNYRN